MNKIGLFYGPLGGSVEKVAGMIAQQIGTHKVDVIKVKDLEIEVLKQYSHIIMGISTLGKHVWSSEYENTDWDDFMPKLKKLDLSGTKVAIFGLGDHIGYADHFVDAIGDLAAVVMECGGELVGRCITEDYEFNESRAVHEGFFLGLPLDEDYEPEKTAGRIDKWIEKLMVEFL